MEAATPAEYNPTLVEIKRDGKGQADVEFKLKMLKKELSAEEIQMFKDSFYTEETVILDQEYWGADTDLLKVTFNLGLVGAIIKRELL